MGQSTTPPPPPKHGGSGAFIGVAALMLLAIAGLLYWKFGREEPPPPEPIVERAEPKPPVFEAPPPPPPPVEPDAGEVKKEKPKKTRVVSTRSGVCGPNCLGKETGALVAGLRATAGRSQGCYERALRTNQLLQGRMVVRVRVGSTGSVCSANVVTNSLGDQSVTSCVVQKFRGASFAKPNGGCVDINVPISFKPRTK